MKPYKFIPLLALGALMATSCHEDPVLPPMIYPESDMVANMSILDLKTTYWQTESNYYTTIPVNAEGEDIIIKGRVQSSDETGNIYKNLIIADETAAITIAINKTSLYQTYQYGQEVYINVTGLEIGGYSGLMQLGSGSDGKMTFMEEATMTEHAQQSGLAKPDLVEPVLTDIPTLNTAKANTNSLIEWQSRLIKLEGMTFETPGQPFAESSNTNVGMKDANGNRIILRCSQYATFSKKEIPAGTGSVTAILSYFGSDWQLLLIDLDGLQGFDSADEPGDDNPEQPGESGAGSKEEPYTVTQVIGLNNPGSTSWVKGYIVGFYDYENNSSLVTSATGAAVSNIALAATKDETDKTKTVAIQLPVGDIRSAVNLVDHPENLGKELAICGELIAYFGLPGVKNATAASLDGTEIGAAEPTPGETETFVKATAIESGKVYAFWADNKLGTAFSADKNYGYLNVTDCTPAADGSIAASTDANGFTFTQTADGWTIQNPDGRYLMMTGEFNSVNLSATLDSADKGYFWTVTIQADGSAKVENVGKNKSMQYSAEYKSFGWYPDSRGTMPTLYQPK